MALHGWQLAHQLSFTALTHQQACGVNIAAEVLTAPVALWRDTEGGVSGSECLWVTHLLTQL